MSHPLISVPLLTTNPVGWAVLGVAGYLVYKAGKKTGLKRSDAIEKEGLADRAVKGAMKAAYKTKLKTDVVLADAREKYTGMWREARAEVSPKK